jgi:hypothetical protein
MWFSVKREMVIYVTVSVKKHFILSCDSLPKINVCVKTAQCVYREALIFMYLLTSLTLVFSINCWFVAFKECN